MSSQNNKGSIKVLLSKGLSIFGLLFYIITMAWCIPGVWWIVFKQLSILLLIAESQAIPYEDIFQHTSLFLWISLAAYYLFFNQRVSNFFAFFIPAKPLIIVGIVFLSGLLLVNNILFYLINYGYDEGALIAFISFGGLLLTRIAMMFLFHRYPAEWFAAR